MYPCKVRSLPVWAVLALVLPLANVATAAPVEAPVTVLSLSGLEAGQVRQCGIRVLSGSGADQVTLEIALERSGPAADLVVRAAASGNGSRKISDVRLVPRATQIELSDALTTSQGTERRAPASDEKVTAFIHELMLRGTRVVVGAGQRDVEIDVAGPLSASVRAAYLNCAGDLYRPGE